MTGPKTPVTETGPIRVGVRMSTETIKKTHLLSLSCKSKELPAAMGSDRRQGEDTEKNSILGVIFVLLEQAALETHTPRLVVCSFVLLHH